MPLYTRTLSLDLGTVEPSLAGPKRPQDRVPLSQMKAGLPQSLPHRSTARFCSWARRRRTDSGVNSGQRHAIGHGAVVIAAITSCTNTSNPSVMVAAGLLAKNAVERGLRVKPLRQDQPGAGLPRGHRLPG